MHPRNKASKFDEESKDSISPTSTNLSDQPTIKQAETSLYFEINSTTLLEDIENNEKDVKLLNATIDQVKLIINKRCLISVETPAEILAALSPTNLLCIESDISDSQIEKLPNHLNNVLISNTNFPPANLSKFKGNFSRFSFENIPEPKLQNYVAHLPAHVRAIVLNEYSLGINKALKGKKNIDQLIIGKISTISNISDLTPTIFSLSVWKNVSIETLKSIPDSIKYLIILDELSDEKLTAIPSHVVLYGSYFTSDTIKNLPENIRKLYAMPCVEQAIKLNCLPESIDTLFTDKKTNCKLLKNLPAQIRQIMFRDINLKTQIPVIASHIHLIYDQTQSYNQEIIQAISKRNSTINISNAKDNKSNSVIINNSIQKERLKQDDQKDTSNAKTKDKELEQKKANLLARFHVCCNHYKKPKVYNFKKLDEIVSVSEENVSISLESYEKDIKDQLKSDKTYVRYREKLDDCYISVKASITKIEDIRNNIGNLEYKLKTQIEVETDKIKNDLEINNFESAENSMTAIQRLNNNLDLEIKSLNENFQTIESKTKTLTDAFNDLKKCIDGTIKKLNKSKEKEGNKAQYTKNKKENKVDKKGKVKEKPSNSISSSSSIAVPAEIVLKNDPKSVEKANGVSEKGKKLQPLSTSSVSSGSMSKNEGLNSHQKSDYSYKKPKSRTLADYLPDYFRKLIKDSNNNKDRTVTSYEDNHSSSVSGNKNLSEAIEEHARFRVDLFFLLLMACYNTRKNLALGKTVLQHGKGSKYIGTQAAHRSILPSLIDTSNGKTFLKGTHLYNELNATDELPEYVNKFDDILESRRNYYLSIINDVSNDERNPVEGLHLFLIDLKKVLLSLKTKQFYLSHLINSNVKYEQKDVENVILHSLMGTTKNIIDDKNCINTVYTNDFLGLNEDDKKIFRIKDPFEEDENEVYKKSCEEFQKSLEQEANSCSSKLPSDSVKNDSAAVKVVNENIISLTLEDKVAKEIEELESKYQNWLVKRKSNKDKRLENIQESPEEEGSGEDIEEFKNNDSESPISLPAQSNNSGITSSKPKTPLEDRVARLGFILHLINDDNINHEGYIYSLAILSEISRIIDLFDPTNQNIFPLYPHQAKEFLNNIKSNPLLFMDEENLSTKAYHLSILNDKKAFENLGWRIFNYFKCILKSESAHNKDSVLVSKLENDISMLPLFKRLINKDCVNKNDAPSKLQKIVDDNIELFNHLMGMSTCSADVLYPAIGFLAARISSLDQDRNLIPDFKKIAVAYWGSHDYFDVIHKAITTQEYLKYLQPKNILTATGKTKEGELNLKDEPKSSEIAKKEVNSCDVSETSVTPNKITSEGVASQVHSPIVQPGAVVAEPVAYTPTVIVPEKPVLTNKITSEDVASNVLSPVGQPGESTPFSVEGGSSKKSLEYTPQNILTANEQSKECELTLKDESKSKATNEIVGLHCESDNNSYAQDAKNITEGNKLIDNFKKIYSWCEINGGYLITSNSYILTHALEGTIASLANFLAKNNDKRLSSLDAKIFENLAVNLLIDYNCFTYDELLQISKQINDFIHKRGDKNNLSQFNLSLPEKDKIFKYPRDHYFDIKSRLFSCERNPALSGEVISVATAWIVVKYHSQISSLFGENTRNYLSKNYNLIKDEFYSLGRVEDTDLLFQYKFDFIGVNIRDSQFKQNTIKHLTLLPDKNIIGKKVDSIHFQAFMLPANKQTTQFVVAIYFKQKRIDPSGNNQYNLFNNLVIINPGIKLESDFLKVLEKNILELKFNQLHILDLKLIPEGNNFQSWYLIVCNELIDYYRNDCDCYDFWVNYAKDEKYITINNKLDHSIVPVHLDREFNFIISPSLRTLMSYSEQFRKFVVEKPNELASSLKNYFPGSPKFYELTEGLFKHICFGESAVPNNKPKDVSSSVLLNNFEKIRGSIENTYSEISSEPNSKTTNEIVGLHCEPQSNSYTQDAKNITEENKLIDNFKKIFSWCEINGEYLITSNPYILTHALEGAIASIANFLAKNNDKRLNSLDAKIFENLAVNLLRDYNCFTYVELLQISKQILNFIDKREDKNNVSPFNLSLPKKDKRFIFKYPNDYYSDMKSYFNLCKSNCVLSEKIISVAHAWMVVKYHSEVLSLFGENTRNDLSKNYNLIKDQFYSLGRVEDTNLLSHYKSHFIGMYIEDSQFKRDTIKHLSSINPGCKITCNPVWQMKGQEKPYLLFKDWSVKPGRGLASNDELYLRAFMLPANTQTTQLVIAIYFSQKRIDPINDKRYNLFNNLVIINPGMKLGSDFLNILEKNISKFKFNQLHVLDLKLIPEGNNFQPWYLIVCNELIDYYKKDPDCYNFWRNYAEDEINITTSNKLDHSIVPFHLDRELNFIISPSLRKLMSESEQFRKLLVEKPKELGSSLGNFFPGSQNLPYVANMLLEPICFRKLSKHNNNGLRSILLNNFEKMRGSIENTYSEISKKEVNSCGETFSSSETFKGIVSFLEKSYSVSVTLGSSSNTRLSLQNLLSSAKQCEIQPQEKNLQESFIREILEEKNKWTNLPTINYPKFSLSYSLPMEKLLDKLIEFFDPTFVDNVRNSIADLSRKKI